MTDLAVAQLLARVRIEEVLYRWARAADLRRPDEAAALFTDDCVVDYGPRFPHGALHGRAAYAAYMRESQSDSAFTAGSASRVRTTRVTHHVSNVLIEFLSPLDAEATSRCVSWIEHRDGHTSVHWSLFTDRLVETRHGWRICRRRTARTGAHDRG